MYAERYGGGKYAKKRYAECQPVDPGKARRPTQRKDFAAILDVLSHTKENLCLNLRTTVA